MRPLPQEDGPEPGAAAVGEAAHHKECRRHLLRIPPALHGLPVHGGAPVLHQQGKITRFVLQLASEF